LSGESDRPKGSVWPRRKEHPDLITRAHLTVGRDHRHHTCLADQLVVGISIEYGGQQARLPPVELPARVAQPGDLDDRRGAEPKPRTSRQCEQVDASCGDVLADIAGGYSKARTSQLVVQLSVDQVNLAKIRLIRIPGNSRSVLHPLAQMGVPLHSEPGQQPDAPSAGLGE
jgi:hypothetical protein